MLQLLRVIADWIYLRKGVEECEYVRLVWSGLAYVAFDTDEVDTLDKWQSAAVAGQMGNGIVASHSKLAGLPANARKN